MKLRSILKIRELGGKIPHIFYCDEQGDSRKCLRVTIISEKNKTDKSLC